MILNNIYEMHQLGHNLLLKKKYKLVKILNVLKRIIYPAADIPFDTEIGEGTLFPHRGIGVIINKQAVIGKKCKISAGVVIGGKDLSGAPVIGDHCLIGANACVIGNCSVGENSIVGAGAVVLRDVPSNEVWGGGTSSFY